MFLILGTFAIVILMLVIGFIGESVSELFSKAKSSSESISSKEDSKELATA